MAVRSRGYASHHMVLQGIGLVDQLRRCHWGGTGQRGTKRLTKAPEKLHHVKKALISCSVQMYEILISHTSSAKL